MLSEDIGLFEIILILAAVLGVGYLGYTWYEDNLANGGGSTDPTTGQSNGVVNSLNDMVLGSDANPGGGEVSGSSETFTGAVNTLVTQPWNSLVSLFGGNPAS